MKLMNTILIILAYIFVFDIGIAAAALLPGIFGIIFAVVIVSYLNRQLKVKIQELRMEGKL